MDSKETEDAPKVAAKRTPPGGAHYTGDGSTYLGGIPARNLSAEEWAALTDEQRAACLETGLYKLGSSGRTRIELIEDEPAPAPTSPPASKET